MALRGGIVCSEGDKDEPGFLIFLASRIMKRKIAAINMRDQLEKKQRR
jgi:hypothetical protein